MADAIASACCLLEQSWSCTRMHHLRFSSLLGTVCAGSSKATHVRKTGSAALAFGAMGSQLRNSAPLALAVALLTCLAAGVAGLTAVASTAGSMRSTAARMSQERSPLAPSDSSVATCLSRRPTKFRTPPPLAPGAAAAHEGDDAVVGLEPLATGYKYISLIGRDTCLSRGEAACTSWGLDLACLIEPSTSLPLGEPPLHEEPNGAWQAVRYRPG